MNYDNNALAKARTSLSDQMDRVPRLIDKAARIRERSYNVGSALTGPFPLPGLPTAPNGEEPYGRIEALRICLDELERQLEGTEFNLTEIEAALAGGLAGKAESPSAAYGAGKATY